jgi:hypothetical protein
MPTPERGGPRIVLDTSCVRGTSRAAIAALTARGLQVQISGLALSELAVHFASDAPDASERERIAIRRRMGFLLDLFGGAVPLAPTHAALVDKLGGRVVGIGEVPYQPWLEGGQKLWNELAGGDVTDPNVSSLVDTTASYVHETGEDFIKTSQAVAAFGEPTEADILWARHFAPLLPSVLDYMELPPPIPASERFDAYLRMLDRQTILAYGRSVGQYRAQSENDAIDLNVLQHLADGLIVVTRDYRLIEEVDACCTAQAPWVRTVGELLAGRVPHGAPFRYSASKAKQKHHQRNRENLRLIDQQGETLARHLMGEE